MKINILAAVLLFLSIDLYSQVTVQGRVTDAVSGEPLANTSIYLNDVQKLITSDSEGNFIFSGLPRGFLKFQFSLLGYKSLSLVIETDKIDSPLEAKMYQDNITTEEILVNELRPQKSYPTAEISSKELMRYGVMNISEAVTKVPGAWQLSTGTGISKPVIRGLYGNRIGIMVNGIRFDNQQWQDEHGLVMSSDGIDNVEVIKGPRSLLYGPEAIGGVVSITDEHPAPVGEENADLNTKFYTNTLGILADIGMKGSRKDFNWLVRFGGETHADYLDGNEDRIPQTRFGGYTVKSAFGYNKSSWVSRINYSYTNYTYGILEARDFEKEIAVNETRFDRSFNGPHHQLKVHNIVLSNTFIMERSKFKINIGHTYNRRQEREGNDERFLPDSLQFGNLDMVLNTTSIDAGWIYTLSKSTELTFGTQGFIQSNINYGKRRLIPDSDVKSISATGMINIRKGKFTFEGGARFDIFSVKTVEYGVKDSLDYYPAIDPAYRSVNGSAGLTYRFINLLLLKANVSTGYRAPNLAELTSNGLHEGVFQYELGNKDFKSEQSIEADLGFDLESRFFSAEISAYVNRINNYIYLGQTKDTLRGYPVFRYIQSDATLRGLEADLTIKPIDWLSLRTTYSTVFAKRSDDVNLPLIPADKITAALHFELNSWKFFRSPYIELSSLTALAKTRLGENETGVPAYTIFNAGFGCDLRFEKQLINITISCNNLLNKVYTDFMSRIKLLTAEYNGRVFNANNIGRNIVLAVKIPFKLSYN